MRHVTKDRDVSAVVSVHNEEKTLNQCLSSVRRQTVAEIIVVLDGCEDDSEKIAKKHAEKDPRVKILFLPKHSFKENYMAETANFGISKAKNDVICLVDADTVLGCHYVSSLLPYLKEPVSAICGMLIPISKRFLQFFETIGGTGRLFPRQVWKEIGGFQDVKACDTFFDLELLKRGYEFKVIKKVIMYDIREYSTKKLVEQGIRRGKGRRQLGQSFFFMIGHGLYCLTKTPFGLVELLANIIGYLTTHRRVSREGMKLYEARRIQEIIRR